MSITHYLPINYLWPRIAVLYVFSEIFTQLLIQLLLARVARLKECVVLKTPGASTVRVTSAKPFLRLLFQYHAEWLPYHRQD